MKRLCLLVLLPFLAAMPAYATEWLNCTAEGEKAEMDVLLGLMDYIAIDTINLTVGKKKWSNKKGGEGTLIEAVQAYESADTMLIDVGEAGGGAVVAQLRLFKSTEGDDDAYGGTLRVVNEGAWAVICSGP